MILQTRSSVLRDLLAIESGPVSHLDALKDALMLARETAFYPPESKMVSNDRTSLPHQKR